jgi:hypothetical protein
MEYFTEDLDCTIRPNIFKNNNR